MLILIIISCKNNKVTGSDGNTQSVWEQQHQMKYLWINGIDFYNNMNGVAVGVTAYVDSDGFTRNLPFGMATNDGGVNWSYGNLPHEVFFGVNAVQNLDGSNIWSCGNYGTISHSSDGGYNWEEIATGEYGISHYTFNDIYFINQNQGWIAVGSQSNSGWIGQVLYTSNAGLTWQILYSKDSGHPFNKIMMVDENNGFAVTGRYQKYRLMKTIDGGNNWTVAFEAEEGSSLSDLYVFNTNHILAIGRTTDAKLLSVNTIDGGLTWSKSESLAFYPFDIDFSDDNNGWISGWEHNSGDPAILNTTDGGVTWILDATVDGFWDDDYNNFQSFDAVSVTSDGSVWVAGNDGRIFKRK